VTARVGASRLVALGLALMLGACATVAGTPSSYGPLVARHREKALKLERSGDLRRALDEWQIALTLEPHNAAAREGQARLEARLQRALASRLRQGQEALRRGAQLEARRNFLAALALDPGNKVAFETLRDRVKEIHFVSHTVARGETLASIADRYYGDRLRSEVIWEMNQLSSRPKAGSQLKIPEIPGVPFRTAAPQRTAAARRLEPTRPEPTRPEPTPQEPKRAEPAQPEPTQPEPPDAEPAQPEPPAPAAEAEESAREELTTEANPLLVDTREALERKEYDVALLGVDKLLEGNPRNPEWLDLKKSILYEDGKDSFDRKNYDEAHRTFSQLVELDRHFKDSAALLREARAKAIQQHYSEGIRLYREEQLEAAIAKWQAVLEYDSQHVDAKKNIDQAERILRALQERQRKQ